MTRIVRLPSPPAQYDQGWAARLVQVLEQRSVEDSAPHAIGYSVSNHTPTRSLNMATATATDIGNFVATLVSDLLLAGIVRK